MKEMADKNSDLIQGNFGQNPIQIRIALPGPLIRPQRELLLAESSDWPFIMKAGTMVAYAEKRLKTHLNRFYKLIDSLEKDYTDENWLKEVGSQGQCVLRV